ncbi:MAG: nicotinate (nicotinamide) nucleotide adenylyltransferase [Oscillospiraceae bacterium]
MMSKNKIAIFGGTFNPIHLGHINLCNECAKIINPDEVLLVPTNLPPHKTHSQLATNRERLDMINIAIRNEKLFKSSDIEYKLQGKSYTINTIDAIKKENPEAQLYLIIGSDMLFMFEKWYMYEDILKQATLVVAARQPQQYQQMLVKKQEFKGYEDKIVIASIGEQPMSSTKIRELIKKNDEDAKKFLDTGVYKYIIDNRLYL